MWYVVGSVGQPTKEGQLDVKILGGDKGTRALCGGPEVRA